MALTAADIQEYTKDKPELNILLEGSSQSAPALIDLSMRMAVSGFNSMSPATDFTVENFPNDAVLLYGTLHHLANSEAERQLRNNVNYSAQGLDAALDDKFQQYNALASFYKKLFDQNAQQLKVYINNENAWGGMLSPYAYINTYHFNDA